MTSNARQGVASLPKDSSWYWRLTQAIVAVVFGGLALWSIVAPIDSAIIAGGQVIVESNRKAIQHLEGGVVAEIRVREGDKVKEGDVLIRLQDTTQRAALAQIDEQLSELYARRLRLVAQRDAAAALGAPSGEEAVLKSTDFSDKFAGQQALFEASRTTRETRASLIDQRINQQRQRIAGYRAQQRSLGDQARIAADELKEMRKLFAQGDASKRELSDAERAHTQLTGERGAVDADIAEAESIIAEARLELARLNETDRETVMKELADVVVSIGQLEERRIAAADALRRAELKAPHAGRVIALKAHTVGGVIAPGDALMEVVPEGDKLQIAARVLPQDVDRIVAGQATLVRFSAFGNRRTPEANGVVRTISADSLTDRVTGSPYFLVIIDLPARQLLDSALGGRNLVPGMPVEAYIKTGSRPAIMYLLRPLLDSTARSMRED
jgi:HlyD family secretion protein